MDLTEEAKEEIRAAIRILREDGVHVHKTAERYLKSKETEVKPEPEVKPEVKPEETEGQPPPVKPEKPVETKPKKRGIGVWGDHEG